jgi:Tol biopolymer transport system component
MPIQVLPSGFLIFRRGSDVFAASFDLQRAMVTGNPIQILDNVNYDGINGGSMIAVAPDATMVYLPLRSVGASRSLVWVDQARSSTGPQIPSRPFEDPRISPDAARIAFEDSSTGDDIWVVDLRRDAAATRLTFDPGEDETPVWSPDGKWVAYAGSHVGTGTARNVFRKMADGSGSEEALFASDRHVHVDDWSRDGKVILLSIDGGATQSDIWALPFDGSGKAQSLLASKFNERNARLSPDGRWIAYTSNESNTDEVYVQPFPSLAGKWQISTRGGDQAVWARNGQMLYYRAVKQLMVVDLTSAGNTIERSPPRMLFEDVYESKGLNHIGYDVGPDGRFLFVRDSDTASTEKYLSVIENFLPELRRRAAAR